MKAVLQAVDFSKGMLPTKHPRMLPEGVMADLRNMIASPQHITTRPGTYKVYDDPVVNSATASGVAIRKVPLVQSGALTEYLIVGSNLAYIYAYTSDAQTATATEYATVYMPSTVRMSIVTDGSAIWVAVPNQIPIRYDFSQATVGQVAGCWAPDAHPTEAFAYGINYTLDHAASPGLDAGSYWYAVTGLVGADGKYGRSGLGYTRQLAVLSAYDGEARVDGNMPVTADAWTDTDRHSHVVARELWRTKVGGDRNGPYYYIQTFYDMTTSTFEDQIPDSALDSTALGVKYMDDPPMTPPISSFVEIHEGTAYWGTVSPNAIYPASANTPDLVDMTRGCFLNRDEPLHMTGLVSTPSGLYAATPTSLYSINLGSVLTAQNIEGTLGVISPNSLSKRESGFDYLSTYGVVEFDGSQARLMGGDRSKFIYDYLRERCHDWSRCIGVHWRRRYWLFYPDSLDNQGAGVCTRALIFDPYMDGVLVGRADGLNVTAATVYGDRLLYVDSKNKPRVLEFVTRTRDWNTASSGSYTDPTRTIVTGNLLQTDSGQGGILESLEIRHAIPPSASGTEPTVKFTVDGTDSSTVTLNTSDDAIPGRRMIKAPRKTANTVQATITCSADVGEWDILGMTAKVAKVGS